LVYQSLVFLSNNLAGLCDNSVGEALFDQLMAKFARKVAVDEENTTVILMAVTFHVPDQAAAETLGHTLGSILTHDDSDATEQVVMPWLGYYPGYLAADADEIRQFYQIDLDRRRAEREWDKTHETLKEEMYREAGTTSKDWAAEKSSQIHLALRDMKERKLQHIPKLEITQSIRFHGANADTGARIPWWSKGTVETKDRQIRISGLSFSQIARGLPAFVAWLQDQGCTDISYSFEQH
jgi:hypothetical protein